MITEKKIISIVALLFWGEIGGTVPPGPCGAKYHLASLTFYSILYCATIFRLTFYNTKKDSWMDGIVLASFRVNLYNQRRAVLQKSSMMGGFYWLTISIATLSIDLPVPGLRYCLMILRT